MASPRLLAFHGELHAAMPALQARAEALILRVPGEGQPALARDAEAQVLQHVGEALAPAVQGWVRAVQELAEVERGWGSREAAAAAGQRFNAATEAFLAVWERLLLVQPATEPMRHVLGLVHTGCYELFLSGPMDLWRSCRAIVEEDAPPRLGFEPRAPSLQQATHELRRLQPPGAA